MSFGGFGQNNQQQPSTGFGGFGANNNPSSGKCNFHAILVLRPFQDFCHRFLVLSRRFKIFWSNSWSFLGFGSNTSFGGSTLFGGSNTSTSGGFGSGGMSMARLAEIGFEAGDMVLRCHSGMTTSSAWTTVPGLYGRHLTRCLSRLSVLSLKSIVVTSQSGPLSRPSPRCEKFWSTICERKANSYINNRFGRIWLCNNQHNSIWSESACLWRLSYDNERGRLVRRRYSYRWSKWWFRWIWKHQHQ